ncbi:MAG: S41 family peptidase [Duncaniella sp.]|nr:S41 family peptidase [Duncaniella sp.]
MKKILLIALSVLAMAAAVTGATRSRKNEISRNLDIFNSVYKELQTFYVDSIDAERSINVAIAAMLNDIDPYTEYISAKDQEGFRSMTTGEYAGIGSLIQERPGGKVIISEPYEGSPAALAGLRPGDHILAIDGDSTAGWRSDKVSERLKGQAGTRVTVTVNRPYTEDSILTFDISRRKIQIPSVPYYGMAADGVGYIALNSFTDKSYDEVRDALLDLKNNRGVRSLILDLRGNGGGLLESAVKILGLFLPKNTEVLTTRGKGVLNERTYKTSVKPVDTKMPVVVLIDGATASSSEIVTGALQDLDRAVVVGNRSFGKGLVQGTRQLPYEGLLKITTAKYYIPSGRLIQAIDYSRRNPDGSVARIPDSLTTVFHTAGGREVRDGGGITPDVKIDYPDVNRITYNVVRDNWSFDFATRYAATHDSIPAPADFEVTDTIYEQFKQSIDPSRFQYDKVLETAMKQMRELARTEGYMNDSTAAEFDRLEAMLRHDLYRDLDTHRADIVTYLAPEILSRYYFNKGELEYDVKHSPDVKRAVEILSGEEYEKILHPKSSR